MCFIKSGAAAAAVVASGGIQSAESASICLLYVHCHASAQNTRDRLGYVVVIGVQRAIIMQL